MPMLLHMQLLVWGQVTKVTVMFALAIIASTLLKSFGYHLKPDGLLVEPFMLVIP